jgi:8-oxo-dGTP diphosphatase
MDVTVDIIVFAYDDETLKTLLIKRAFEPFIDQYALAGGFVMEAESAENAAFRKLENETNLNVNHIEQVYTFADPNRDPRGRVITIAYMVLTRLSEHTLKTNEHASEVRWVSVSEALKMPLAFDHNRILDMAYHRLANKIRYMPIGFELLPDKFTIAELHKMYCVIADMEFDVGNFHRQIKKSGLLIDTGLKQKTTSKPATLYEFNRISYREMEKKGINFKL